VGGWHPRPDPLEGGKRKLGRERFLHLHSWGEDFLGRPLKGVNGGLLENDAHEKTCKFEKQKYQ